MNHEQIAYGLWSEWVFDDRDAVVRAIEGFHPLDAALVASLVALRMAGTTHAGEFLDALRKRRWKTEESPPS